MDSYYLPPLFLTPSEVQDALNLGRFFFVVLFYFSILGIEYFCCHLSAGVKNGKGGPGL